MSETFNLEKIGIIPKGKIHRNLSVEELIEKAVERKEGVIAKNKSLSVNTSPYTGRSPNDRFIVESESVKSYVEWNSANKPISTETFDKLYKKTISHLNEKDELFIFDGSVGADKNYSLKLRVVSELASQALASNNLFIRPSKEELENHIPDYTVLSAPSLKAVPELDGTNSEAFIILNFEKKIVLIGSTKYIGEIKKSIFTVMNYILTFKDVLPMHCSANEDSEGNSALFFGLSGTGKTTLSNDPSRVLVGDDEHGWSDIGVFNFEGGCYAKCIKLNKEKEPQIWDAIKHGTLVENAVMREDSSYDYDDASITENSRAAYPLTHIPSMKLSGVSGHPKTIIFLTADAFGVMPFISKLSKQQALYFFAAGYTSKLAGTERGINEPVPTFSVFFGEPFMPAKHSKYLELLKQKLDTHNTSVFMINTGWGYGPAGVGSRIDIDYSRAMVNAATSGKLNNAEYTTHKIFNLEMPTHCPNVPDDYLNPENLWKDKDAYISQAKKLAALFEKRFTEMKCIPKDISDAGIHL
ncbi:MAG: phosphoenolpyruvate carboxykinase (ATP) [Candidatus Diapherotrites archaeon]